MLALYIGALAECRFRLKAAPDQKDDEPAGKRRRNLHRMLTPSCSSYLSHKLQEHGISDFHGSIRDREDAEDEADLFRSVAERVLGIVVLKLPGFICNRFADLKSKDQVWQCPLNVIEFVEAHLACIIHARVRSGCEMVVDGGCCVACHAY